MVTLTCSICQHQVFNCEVTKNYVPWRLLICQNCVTNTQFLRFIKQTYSLIENVVYQQEIQKKLAIQSEFKAYREKFYQTQNAVSQALVNQNNRKFTQKYIKFIESVKDQQSKFSKEIEQIKQKIVYCIEMQAKRVVIDEIKKLNKGIQMQEQIHRINLEKVRNAGEQIKIKIQSIKFTSQSDENNPKNGSDIFDSEQINEFMDIFNKKVKNMNNKINQLSDLSSQARKILTHQSDLPKIILMPREEND